MVETGLFIMSPIAILEYTFLAVLVYLLMYHPDLKDKIKAKVLPGFAIAIASWFNVGLYCLFTIAFYFLGVWVIDTWKKRLTLKKV
jgi:hypothetical protein